MTLWPVDDESAREWIRELYEGRFERGLTTDRAASSASRTVLDRLRAKGEIPHPFLWGNFLAAGDWR
jgi:CHAT domain-containing protein